MNKLQTTTCLMMVVLLSAPASVALAEKGGKSQKHAEPIFAQGIFIGIDGGDKARISQFLQEDYQKNCPPGLAKKNNGCLPPGQAKKYKIGSVYEGAWSPIPDELADMLRGAPVGHRYVMVDKDVLLIAEASKQVIDAVTLLSAVGR